MKNASAMSAARRGKPLLTDPEFDYLRETVIRWTGLDYYGARADDFADRVYFRMSARGLYSLADYTRLLQVGTESPDAAAMEERDALIDSLTIGETYFFRYREQFMALEKDIFPRLLERNADRRSLSIWCAGCSNGAEPYSVSILLHRHFAGALEGWQVDILGTELSIHALDQARRAVYLPWSLRGLEQWECNADFDPDPSTRAWELKPEYRRSVRFARHNLITDPPPGRFDLIFCRNVLIYFSEEAMRSVIAGFAGAIGPGGWLLLGHAEPTRLPELQMPFATVRVPGAHLYRRRDQDVVDSEAFNFVPLTMESAGSVEEVDRWSRDDDATAAGSALLPPGIPSGWNPLPLPDFLPPPAVDIPKEAPAENASHYNVASIRTQLDRGDFAGALRTLNSLIGTTGDVAAGSAHHDPTLHYYRALALERTGDWEEAEAELRRALYLDRTFVLAHFQMGLLLEQRGASEGALRSYTNALNLLEIASDGRSGAETDRVAGLLSEIGGIDGKDMAEVIRLRLMATRRQERLSDVGEAKAS